MKTRRTLRRSRRADHNFYEPVMSAAERKQLTTAPAEGLADEADLLRILILRDLAEGGDRRIVVQELTLLARIVGAQQRLGAGIDAQLALDIAAEVNRLAEQGEQEVGDA